MTQSAQELLESFQDVNKLMEEAHYRKAYQQSAVVLTRMSKFNSFVTQELARLRDDLKCCEARSRLDTTLGKGESSVFDVLYSVSQVVMVGTIFWWVLGK